MRDFGQQRPLVLVVDGEQEVLEKISELLSGAGFGVLLLRDGRRGDRRRLGQPARPDRLRLEPARRETAWKLASRSSSNRVWKTCPVMFLSSAQRPDVIRRAHVVDNGVYCLRKPLRPKVLVELIDQALDRAGGCRQRVDFRPSGRQLHCHPRIPASAMADNCHRNGCRKFTRLTSADATIPHDKDAQLVAALQGCEGGVEKLTLAQAEEQLAAISGWRLNDDGTRLRKDWQVENFLAGIEFFERVAELAEAEGHHPDLHLEGYRNVWIELWTHAVGGLSENDFILAAKIDRLPIRLRS